jgi:hypothetical protein
MDIIGGTLPESRPSANKNEILFRVLVLILQ